MEQLTSKRFELPVLYFITNKKEIKDLPLGMPFFYGDESIKPYIIRLLEYEVIYQKAIATKMPFNFGLLLKEAGFETEKFWYYHPVYMDYITEDDYLDDETIEDFKLETFDKEGSLFKEFIKDSVAYVDLEKLKNLNVFPIWATKLEEALSKNLYNYAVFNPNMYNKKLDGMYGSIDLTSPQKSLVIIDISSSIPEGVSATILVFGKNLAESLYADVLITGSKSTLYVYEELHLLDITRIYEENGTDNDQAWFKKLVSTEKRVYETAIVFGDNHSPCNNWNNEFNKKTTTISREDGKKLCKWEINKLISFHTKSTEHIAGYADWFTVNEIEKIDNWVKYLVNN